MQDSNLDLNLADLSQEQVTELLSQIKGLALHSRYVAPGYLFAALQGVKADGAEFIPQALENGATHILIRPGVDMAPYFAKAGDTEQTVTILRSKTPRRDLGRLLAAFYEDQPTHIAAVTGTNGKTSVTDYVYQILNGSGLKAGSIGSLGVKPDGYMLEEGMTSPDVGTTYRILANFVERDIDYAVLEASSHGLDQSRVNDIRLEAAAFTNLSPDHLDYHATMEEYLAAKLRLFEEVLPSGKTAVLNKGADVFDQVLAVCEARGHKILTVGTEDADLYRSPDGHLSAFGKSYDVDWPVSLPFQVDNLLCAIGLCIGLGLEMEEIVPRIPEVVGVNGRMELISTLDNKARIFVDYAHTAYGLKIVLEEARQATSGKVHLVFGCGGNKPPQRRPDMGKVAQELADVIYIVDNNPRFEDPATIRQQILATCPKGREFTDRGAGIEAAIAELGVEDILIIAGKGHETTHQYGHTHHPYSDQQAVREAVLKLGLKAA